MSPVDQLFAGIAALVAGGLLGAAATVLVHFRELKVRRVLESTALFLSTAATAHGYRVPGETPVGRGEQIAAIRLIGVLGSEYKPLREPARDFLRQYRPPAEGEDNLETKSLLANAALDALADLPKTRRRPVV